MWKCPGEIPPDAAEESPCFFPALFSRVPGVYPACTWVLGYLGTWVLRVYLIHSIKYNREEGTALVPWYFHMFGSDSSYYQEHLYQLSISQKWLKNESNKTSSVVGYHIEMPANARLRSSGFVAWDFFFLLSGCSEACPKDFSDRILSNKQRPKKRDDRQGKRVGGACGNLDSQSACLGASPKNKTKTKTKQKRTCVQGLQNTGHSPHASSEALQDASVKGGSMARTTDAERGNQKIEPSRCTQDQKGREEERERKKKGGGTAIISVSKKSNASRMEPVDHKRVHWIRLRCRDRSGRKDLGYSGPASRSRWPDPKPVGRRSAPRPPAACCRCWRSMRTTS